MMMMTMMHRLLLTLSLLASIGLTASACDKKGGDDKKAAAGDSKKAEGDKKAAAGAKKAEGDTKKAEGDTAKKAAVKVPKVADLKVHDLASLQTVVKGNKKKATLVAVWATWCAPCIAEMPTLAKFYQEHKDKGLEVVGLCVDDRNEDGMGKKIQSVLEKVKVPFEMALLKPETDEAFFKGLGVEWDSGLPATVVFDAEGNKKLYTRKALDEKYLAENVLPLLK